MRRADDDGAGRACELGEEQADRESVGSVETCGRLVGDDRARAGGDGPRDRGALALTRRQLGDRPLAVFLEADGGERGERAFSRVAGATPRRASESSTFSRAPRNGTSATV